MGLEPPQNQVSFYREPPYERATDKLQIHNLELSKYRNLILSEPANALYNWLAALCKAQDSKQSLKEVVNMDAKLKEFYDQDAGFAQFVDRYGIVSATPEIRKAFRRWEYELILDKLEEERLLAERVKEIAEGEARGEARGETRGEARGKAEGKTESQMEFALNILRMKGHSTSTAVLDGEMLGFGIPREIIQAARKQYEELQTQHRSHSRKKTEPDR